MNGRFFLDTNVFVYSFDDSAVAKAKRAANLIREAVETRKGVVSYQIVQEFFNVAIRRFAKPMSAADADHYMGRVFRPLWIVHSSEVLFRNALRICEDNRLPWYDSLAIAAALEAGCNVLYSEDLQHSRKFGSLQILNPFR